MLTFPAPLAKDATTTLRQAGFRFSKVMRHWEGLARFDEAERRLPATHGGTARRVAGRPGCRRHSAGTDAVAKRAAE